MRRWRGREDGTEVVLKLGQGFAVGGTRWNWSAVFRC